MLNRINSLDKIIDRYTDKYIIPTAVWLSERADEELKIWFEKIERTNRIWKIEEEKRKEDESDRDNQDS